MKRMPLYQVEKNVLKVLGMYFYYYYYFQDKAQALQNSYCSAMSENRSSSPVVEPFKPLTPPSSTKKPTVLLIE